jgi:diadenosine tetraphosphate (Ap4A) HIT family hydrolase
MVELRVKAARRGENPHVIVKLPSGWLCIGDTQPLRGYCVLLADPIVSSLNELNETKRIRYSLDTIRIGDGLLAVTGAARINYETLANAEPSLHTHVIPRYADEPESKRRMPPMMAYDWAGSRAYDEASDGTWVRALRNWFETSPAP